jgi:hypothetical protein
VNIRADNPVPAVRSCGECTVCCKATAIVGLAKPCGVSCAHLSAHGCSVYAERPRDPKYRECIAFECLWLQGWFDEADRPDKLGGVMFVGKDDPNYPGELMIHVVESQLGAASNPRAKFLTHDVHQQGHLVVIQNWTAAIVLLPNGDSYRYQIDPGDPLESRIDPNVPPVQITVGGRPM